MPPANGTRPPPVTTEQGTPVVLAQKKGRGINGSVLDMPVIDRGYVRRYLRFSPGLRV